MIRPSPPRPVNAADPQCLPIQVKLILAATRTYVRIRSYNVFHNEKI